MSRRPTGQAHTTWPATTRIVVLATAVLCLVLIAFIWPTRTSTVKDLPIDVVGVGPAVQAATAQLETSGVFDVTTAVSREKAVARIEERRSYAAIITPATPGGQIEILTASAAGPAVSQLMTQAGAQLREQAAAAVPGAAPQVTVTDVVPLVEDDPRGAGLGVASLPLAMGGMAGGVLIALFVVGAWRRVGAIVGYAVLGGLGLAAILGPWLGVVPSFGWSALVIGAALAATSFTIVGLHALMGRPGIALGSVITLFVGNPLASSGSPVEFLPEPWGAVGQLLVPGASATLLRLENYFPAADTVQPWSVLAVWALVGLVLTVTGRFRQQDVVPAAGAVEDGPRPAPVPAGA